MDDFAPTGAEQALFQAALRRGLRFIVVGLGAAAIEGAPLSTTGTIKSFLSSDGRFLINTELDADGATAPITLIHSLESRGDE